MVWTRYTPMWAERDISRLFFNIVPTDINAFVPPLHEFEENLLIKVGVLGPYGCFSVFIGGETASFESPLQRREEVEVAGRQVGTVVGVVQQIISSENTIVSDHNSPGLCIPTGPYSRTCFSSLAK
jgi:hypothetical protein